MPLVQLSEIEIGQVLVAITVVQNYAQGPDAGIVRESFETLAKKLTDAVEEMDEP